MSRVEFLALPEDGVDRMLINGMLWERPHHLATSDHSRVLTLVAYQLADWAKRFPKPRCRAHCGYVGFQLRDQPPTIVSIDAAVISAELAASTPRGAELIEGVPVLAAEILAPDDEHEEVAARVAGYLEVGVKVVWLLDPDFRTVTVHRQDAEPVLFNRTQQLSGEPFLPGFEVAVAELFED